VRTLHEWAALRQLSWRSLYTSRNSADRDSVASIVFSFIDNQLFKIVIDYDRGRTKELTKDDIITSLSAIYGPRSTARAPAPQRSTIDSLDTPTVLARWRQADSARILLCTLEQRWL
jgi:hypothetical protein